MKVITRAEWGAKHGRGADVSSKLPWGEVVVHTEAGAIRTQDWAEIEEWAALNISLSEAQKMRAIEGFHVNTRGWNGIAYSFLFFPDGTICEGRGWGRSGGHTEGRNSTAAGFCLIGHGDKQPATGAQWAAMGWLIAEGIRLGKLTPNPKISGHRNYSTKGKTCPGNLIYPELHRLRGITTGPDTPTPDPIKDGLFMSLTPEQEKRVIDLLEANDLKVTALEQRLARLEAANNTDGNDKGKPPYLPRIIQSLARVEATTDDIKGSVQDLAVAVTKPA